MYDDKINRIRKEDNPANVYSILIETFHGTMELGEVGIRFLKENLTNDFFKEAEVKDEPDHIIFSNEEFDILFSKTLDKTIEIRGKKIKRPFALYKPLSERIIKLGDAIEAFLKERTLQNFKRMADCNDMGYGKNPIGQLFKYVDTYKKCNEELLKKIRKRQKEDEERKKRAEEERKIYEEEIRKAEEFAESLTDLNMFKEAGWIIKKRFGFISEKTK
jgi:hypothetical protein